VRDDARTFRVIYLARMKEAVYVLHAFARVLD
jgi:phage-related protein